MAYHGYTNMMCQFIDALPNHQVRIIEIGTDSGQMLIPLVHHLLKTHRPFEFVGIDILIRDYLEIIMMGMGANSRTSRVNLIKGNSMNVLPDIKGTFDLILVDGDHNYFTVRDEMTHLTRLSRPHTIVLCDDYHGRWSDKDLYYSEREDYAEVENATDRRKTSKQGVRPAIDEFLEHHPNWVGASPIQGEPILMQRRDTGLLQGLV